jgi:hypothetical protein
MKKKKIIELLRQIEQTRRIISFAVDIDIANLEKALDERRADRERYESEIRAMRKKLRKAGC